MTTPSPQAVLDRLHSVKWIDGEGMWEHARSRAVLMREYLRRAAWCVHEYGIPEWAFFNVAEYVGSDIPSVPGMEARLENLVIEKTGPFSLGKSCRSAVHWAALTHASPGILPAHLENPYEPLLHLFERGGGFASCGHYIDLGIGNVSSKTAKEYLDPHPVVGLDSATLDALDGGSC